MPTHNHTNDSWFVGAGSFGNPGISIPQIPNHTYDSWFVDAGSFGTADTENDTDSDADTHDTKTLNY